MAAFFCSLFQATSRDDARQTETISSQSAGGGDYDANDDGYSERHTRRRGFSSTLRQAIARRRALAGGRARACASFPRCRRRSSLNFAAAAAAAVDASLL